MTYKNARKKLGESNDAPVLRVHTYEQNFRESKKTKYTSRDVWMSKKFARRRRRMREERKESSG